MYITLYRFRIHAYPYIVYLHAGVHAHIVSAEIFFLYGRLAHVDSEQYLHIPWQCAVSLRRVIHCSSKMP